MNNRIQKLFQQTLEFLITPPFPGNRWSPVGILNKRGKDDEHKGINKERSHNTTATPSSAL